MPLSRVENVIDIPLRAGKDRKVRVLRPDGATYCQVVIERVKNEAKAKALRAIKVEMYINGALCGGGVISTGVADYTATRPGRVGLWSVVKYENLPDVKHLDFRFSAAVDVHIHAHVDFM